MQDQRIKDELDAYENEKLERKDLQSILKYSYYYSELAMLAKVKSALSLDQPKKCLELGSQTWFRWFYLNGYKPDQLICINLSQRELIKGMRQNVECNYSITFKKGDAHKLDLPADHFDLVFGRGILHHLDLDQVLIEIQKVVKEEGRIIFFEPLNINPLYRLYRYFNPQQRTKFERAFDLEDLKSIRKKFDVEISYFNIVSIPAGILAKLIFKDHQNFLSRSAAYIDRYLCRIKIIQLLASKCLIIGKLKS